MENSQQSPPNEPAPNLAFLKVLCVLTFIGSGLGFISYGGIGLLFDFITQNLSLIPDEQNRDLVELTLSAGRLFFYLNTLLYGFSFTGALYLWKLKKTGFHLYTLSQLLLLILPLAFIKGYPMPGLTIFLTILFVLGYGGYLKYMK